MDRELPVARLVLLGLFIIIVVTGSLALKSAMNAPRATASEAGGESPAVVSLHGGATLIAEPGTVGRQIVDWLASDATRGQFELGGHQFDGRSVEPTIEAQARLPRLIEMLQSDSDVQVLLVGPNDRSADPAADQALFQARAPAVRLMLKTSGNSPGRLHVEETG